MKRLLCGWLIGESQLLIADWVGCEFVILANWFIDSMKGLLCRRCGLGWLWADDLGPLVRRWVIDSWGVMETMIEIVKKVYQASRKEENLTSSNVLCSSLCLSMNLDFVLATSIFMLYPKLSISNILICVLVPALAASSRFYKNVIHGTFPEAWELIKQSGSSVLLRLFNLSARWWPSSWLWFCNHISLSVLPGWCSIIHAQ